MLANRECQEALEVLLVSPLYDCRCKRAMKKELQCLQSYWSIHMDLIEGETHFATALVNPGVCSILASSSMPYEFCWQALTNPIHCMPSLFQSCRVC